MLGEIGDLHLLVLAQMPFERGQPVTQEFRHCRLAGAIATENADPVLGVDIECDVAQHRLARRIAGLEIDHAYDGRRHAALRAGKVEGRHRVFDLGRHDLHLLQPFHARLGLLGLGRLGLESVDEGLQVPPLDLLLLDHFHLQALTFRQRLLEIIIAAVPDGQLALFEMGDFLHRAIQEITVVRDHQGRAGEGLEIGLQPHHAFQVEIIGRLVQQEKIGSLEQGRRQGHPHAPAAGEFPAGATLFLAGKTKPGQDRAGAGFGGMAVDIGQPGLDFGNAIGFGRGLGLSQKRRSLGIGGHDHVDQAVIPTRRFLGDRAHTRAFLDAGFATFRAELAADQTE